MLTDSISTTFTIDSKARYILLTDETTTVIKTIFNTVKVGENTTINVTYSDGQSNTLTFTWNGFKLTINRKTTHGQTIIIVMP